MTLKHKKIICLDSYPETNFDLIKEAGIEVIQLEKEKIHYWAKKLIDGYDVQVIPK